MPTIPVQGGVPLRCPRDGAALHPFTVADVTVDTCHDCEGTWLDRSEMARVTHDEELERLAADVREGAPPSSFLCPRCRGSCARVHVGDVEVDTCTSCRGIWLDGGELSGAQRAVAVRRDTPRLQALVEKLRASRVKAQR